MMNKLTAQDWGRLIGCKVIWSEPDTGIEYTGTLQGVRAYSNCSMLDVGGVDYAVNANDCQPILRTSSRTSGQMTDVEIEKYLKLCQKDRVDYLDSIYVDQRGWIETGLAVKEGEE
jgi:hypothetical protein